MSNCKVYQILDGTDGRSGQIQYNVEKLDQYERIESFAKRLTYLLFFLSFAAAVAHFWRHAPWLILFTAFLPALAAAVHGINSFLLLPQLVTQHAEMAAALTQMRKRAEISAEGEDWLALSEELLTRLEHGDSAWTGIAAAQDPHPV